MLARDLAVIAPELVLVVAAMAGLMWGAFANGTRDPSGTILWAAVALLVAVGLFVGFQPEGARVMSLGIPLRYTHSMVETVHADDVDATIRMVEAIIGRYAT